MEQISVGLEGEHAPARSHLQAFAPDPLRGGADEGADRQHHLGKVGVHAPELDGAVVAQAHRVPRSPVQIAPRLREEATFHPRPVHRRKPGRVARPLLIYQIFHAARVSAQTTHLVHAHVETFEAEDTPVVDRPGGEPVGSSLVEGAGTGERHERRVEGGGEVVQAEKLPLRGERGASAAFTSGQTVPAGNSRCRCAPAHLPACENLSCPMMLALTA